VYTSAIELLALALFAACLYHSWRTEGKKYAQQWFAIGYLFALLYQVLMVQLGVVSYSDRMLQFGSAPTLTSLLLPSLFYIAYIVAGRFNPEDHARPMFYWIFLLVPALALPVDATALAFDWWSFPSQSRSFLDGIPYFMPLGWGLTGALFYGFLRFVRRIRFRGSGQLFALLLGTPLMAGLSILLVLLAQFLVAGLGLIGSDSALIILMGVMFLALPLASLVTLPQRRIAPRRNR
jgi:hypothetical protein